MPAVLVSSKHDEGNEGLELFYAQEKMQSFAQAFLGRNIQLFANRGYGAEKSHQLRIQ